MGGGREERERERWEGLVLTLQREDKEIRSIVGGTGNGGLIVFFEVEEHTRESSEQRDLTSLFRRVGRGDRSKTGMNRLLQ